ncbi:MFS general substrate transporter [Xylariales sp. PMI_506]|nr:MFS general substrate transporter [Xylariales sp. PMI_506]
MPIIEKTLTNVVLPPTDVGLVPWLQVLGGFLLMFNSWGIVVSYGTFQSYYMDGGLEDQSSESAIAWIGSLQAFLLLFGGALTGKLFDAGYFRHMIIIGTVIVTFGLMMVSLASRYYQFMLAQAITVGGGMGLLTVASMGIPVSWFSARRGIAVGIVSSGVSIGGIVYPIMLRDLIPRVGFPWAVRIIGFVALATLSVSIAVMRARVPPRVSSAPIIELRAMLEPAYAVFFFGFFFGFLGFFTFYNYVEAWAVAEHVDTKGLQLIYILPIVNAASVFGRILPGYLSDAIGPLNVQAPSMALAGVLMLCWLPTHTIGPLMTIAILYGFFSGTMIALGPVATASLTPDMSRFGSRLGMSLIAISLGSLIGNPVSGAIVQAQGGSYDGARIWSGVIMIAGGACVAIARVLKTGPKLMVKA